MRGLFVGVLCFSLIGLFLSDSEARDERAGNVRVWRYWSPEQYASDLAALDPGLLGLYSSAAVDTYYIVGYDFESMDWQGWTQWDNTAQIDTFFHADDFAGLDGGSFGRLVPIEGTKSIWCGARPGTDEYLCSWQSAPGYGENWDQILTTYPFVKIGALHVSYHGVFDSEAGYDFTHVEYDAGGSWVTIHSWDGIADAIATHEILTPRVATKLRFHFYSDGAIDDEWGGLYGYDTDGAAIIDSITIWDDHGVIHFEDFESWEVGAKSSPGSIWYAVPGKGFGIYSSLWAGLEDKDPCNSNFSTQIVFFVGSTVASTDYPGLYVTPFCKMEYYLCQNEMVVSPVIDLAKYSTGKNEEQDGDIPTEELSDLGGALLRFSVYRDLPQDNCVFYVWHVRTIDESGCPGPWKDLNYYYYGGDRKYIFHSFDVGNLIDVTQRMQVALVVLDWVWGEEHTPSPWFDNVCIQRYNSAGPQWSYRALDLFQDNFPEDQFDVESFVRADAADDKAPYDAAFFIPGDSVVVTCTSPFQIGIREGGATGGGEVYCYVRVTDVWPERPGGPKPPLAGLQLEGSNGTYVTDDGEWTKIQCDTAKAQFVNVVPYHWSVDLNDSLLTRGYMVEYYFEAFDVAGDRTTLPRYADRGQYFEFTCLPTGRSDLLYVDDFDGIGSFRGVAHEYWDATFEAVIGPESKPDVYDVNDPSAMVGNGLRSRATLNQLMYDEVEQTGYRCIVWDSGDLDYGTIGTGNDGSDKARDWNLLLQWLYQSPQDVGLLVCGDGIAYEMHDYNWILPMEDLMDYCGVNFVDNSYFDLTGGWEGGGVLKPIVTGASGGIFYHEGAPDQFYLAGGCPLVKEFDVLAPTVYGVEALLYPDYNDSTYVAGIQTEHVLPLMTARTMWLGFSWMSMRDDVEASPIDRNEVFADIYSWFKGVSLGDITDAGSTPVPRNSLAQNHPNPFNPVTTIGFEIKSKDRVSLKIYNVAGQLVKTLVDEVLDAGPHSKEWKGLNDAGSKVASGVYFYRLEAGEYESVRKMVLLR